MPGRSISAKAGLGLLVAFVMAPPTLALPPHVGATTAQEPGLARASSTMVVENVGQWDPAARFQVRGGANLMWLASGAIWLTVLGPDRTRPGKAPGRQPRVATIDQKAKPGANIRLTFVGASTTPKLEPFGPLNSSVSYLRGSDATAWRRGVPVWSGVRYEDL